MSDGKKTDLPDGPLNDSVPTETPKLLQQDLGLDRRAPRAVPSFEQLRHPPARAPGGIPKETVPSNPAQRPSAPVPPEYAPTLISSRRPPPSPLDYAKTDPSAANPVLAKLQADERALAERAAAARHMSERQAAERLAAERLVAERAAAIAAAARVTTPGAATHIPLDPSMFATQPGRVVMPAQRPLTLRQPLASRPLGPPVPAAPPPPRPTEVVTDPMPREAVPPARLPPPPPGAPFLPRPPPTMAQKTDPMQQPDVLAAIGREAPTRGELPPASRVAIPPPEPLPQRAPARPGPQISERTEISRPPLQLTPPPGVAPRTPGLLARPPGLLPRAPAEVPAAIPEPAPSAPARTELENRLPQITVDPPQPTLVLRAARAPSALQATGAAKSSQQDLTPVPPRAASAPALLPTPSATPPAPPARPQVVPPSYSDLPPAMERPRKIGPDLLTTQPGVAGPYAKAPQLGAEPLTPALPSETARDLDPSTPLGAGPTSVENVQSDQVLATPAALWRRALSAVLDLGVIAGLTLLLLLLAVAVGGRPASALRGLDGLLFQLEPIAVPAAGLTILFAVLYTTLGALLRGRTLGRLLLGIRLVDASGKSPGPLRSLLRAVFSLVSFGLFLGGFWLALFDSKGQTLHDKLTRTFVIRPV